MPSDLMLVRNQFDRLERLLGRQLMLVDSLLMILGERTGRARRENSRFTFIMGGGFINLPEGYLWSYTGGFCSFWPRPPLMVRGLHLIVNLGLIGLDKPWMKITMP